MSYVTIETKREGYAPNQCGNTWTVGQLINYLEQFDEDEKIYLSNDNGYTYGSIREYQIDEVYEEDEEDEE